MSRALGVWLGVSSQKCKIPPRSLRGDVSPALGGAILLPVPILCVPLSVPTVPLSLPSVPLPPPPTPVSVRGLKSVLLLAICTYHLYSVVTIITIITTVFP